MPHLTTCALKNMYLSQAGGKRGRQKKAKVQGRNGSLRDEKCGDNLKHCCWGEYKESTRKDGSRNS